MKINPVLVSIATSVALFSAIAVSSQTGEDFDEKSVAWFVANIKEAHNQNRACHDAPSIQNNANCVNSLRALEMSFKGGNYTGSRLQQAAK
ncbi:MAG: hypothetical protein PHT19_10700 [Methylococcus sp.]|nr:hypothetical protein [Methylococcus sp.]